RLLGLEPASTCLRLSKAQVGGSIPPCGSLSGNGRYLEWIVRCLQSASLWFAVDSLTRLGAQVRGPRALVEPYLRLSARDRRACPVASYRRHIFPSRSTAPSPSCRA